MATKTINDYAAAVTIDGANDYFLIEQSSAYKRINRNVMLGVTGTPADLSTVQTFTNKVIGNTNTVTLKDTLFTLQDDGDTTKQAKFQLSGITTATTRTYTLPNRSDTLVDLGSTQTLTSKTLTSPAITGGTIDNTTVTVDSISGHTVAGNGTVYGLAINSGVLQTANSVTTTNIAAGAVTSAKLTLSYGFSAYSTTAQNTGNSAFAQTNFQLEEFDIGNNFASSTFTAPVTGYYHFDARVGTTGTPTILIIALYKNGSVVKTGDDTRASAAVQGVNLSVTIKLTAADTIDVRTFGNAAVAIDVTQANCYFMGYFIGN